MIPTETEIQRLIENRPMGEHENQTESALLYHLLDAAIALRECVRAMRHHEFNCKAFTGGDDRRFVAALLRARKVVGE